MSSKCPLSVIVVAFDRDDLLRRCLESLQLGTDAESPLAASCEIWVVLNDASAEVEAVAEKAAATDSRIRVRRCSRRPAGAARNVAAAQANGEWFYFLDDDVEAPPLLIERFVSIAAEHPQTVVIGGPNLTHPQESEFGRMAGCMMASRLGSGPASARYYERYSGEATERELILCNLAIHRSMFERGLSFPDHYFGGEENVLMGEIAADGGRMRYEPTLWVYHRRRSTWGGHLRQMYRYGAGRAVAHLWAPHTRKAVFFVPVGLALYFLAVPIAGAWMGPLALAPGLAYMVAVAAASLAIGVRQRRPLWVLKLPFLFGLTHLSYGLGLAVTLLNPPPPRDASPKNEESSTAENIA